MFWNDIPLQSEAYSARLYAGTIRMISHYLFIEKVGPMSRLRKVLIDGKFGGEGRMRRRYNRHGREVVRLVQITCVKEVEMDFLRCMSAAGIHSF